jgi:hypothetical protein
MADQIPFLRDEDSSFTPEQLAELKDYFRERKGLFAIDSGYQTKGHGLAEWCLTTDELQGIHIYEKGNMKIGSNVSIELITGFDAESTTGHIVIRCMHGDIKIEAPDGNLHLEGKNVLIKATDAKGSVTIDSPRIIEQRAPVIRVDTGNASTEHSGSGLYCTASDLTLYGHHSASLSEGISQIVDGSLLQKIIGSIEKIKMFFKSICG